MTCDCDNYETPVVSHTCYRVARKAHKCCECRHPIQPGTRYHEVNGIWDDGWETYRTCDRCERVRKALARNGEDCVAFGYMREALQERVYNRHRWAKVWART